MEDTEYVILDLCELLGRELGAHSRFPTKRFYQEADADPFHVVAGGCLVPRQLGAQRGPKKEQEAKVVFAICKRAT